MSTMKGALYGSVCGLIVAALSQRNALFKLFQKELPAPLFIAAGLLAPFGAFLGGFLGFTGAMRKNLKDGRSMVQEQLFGKSSQADQEKAEKANPPAGRLA